MTQHTPAAKWRENGQVDPYAGQYDCERHELTMGSMTDDEMANAVYLHGDSAYNKPSLENLIAGKGHTSGSYLQAAKDRIRWLSRRLVSAEQQRDELLAAINDVVQGTLLDECGNRDEDGMRRRFNHNPQAINRWLRRLESAIAKAGAE